MHKTFRRHSALRKLSSTIHPSLFDQEHLCKKQKLFHQLEEKNGFTFIDLFAGIGGFHEAFKQLGCSCVFACEKDKHARKTYLANHNIPSENFAEDIREVNPESIPSHDVLCAGFPCQPFSIAGKQHGFNDARGTLFFEILKIIKAKRPKAIFLENVRQIYRHDNGNTFATIEHCIRDLGYSFEPYLVWASDFGLPQFRPRVFMIGFRDKLPFSPPQRIPLQFTMSDILGGKCNRKIGFTILAGGRGTPIHDRRNWDGYFVNGKEHRLTIPQAKRMMGLPTEFKLPVSETQTMKQLGNSVAVPAVKAFAEEILFSLHQNYRKHHRCISSVSSVISEMKVA